MTVDHHRRSRSRTILGAIYAAHRDRILVDAAEMPLAPATRVVWVAAGTHASYPFRCDEGCDQYAKLAGTARLPEEHHDGAVSWGDNRDTECAATDCVGRCREGRRGPERHRPAPRRRLGRLGGALGRDLPPRLHRPDPAARGARPRAGPARPRFECPWVRPTRRRRRPDGRGLSDAPSDRRLERLFATCRAQRGGALNDPADGPHQDAWARNRPVGGRA